MKYDYSNYYNKKSNKVLFIIIFIAVIFAISFFLFRNLTFRSYLSSKITVGIEYISNKISYITGNISDILKSKDVLENENSQLKEKLAKLEYSNLEYERLLSENNKLNNLLKISNTYTHFNLIHSKIIIRNHDNFNETFVIDVGHKDGVKVNDTVIHEAGLVGYLSKVDDNTSVVTTLLDPKTSVSVNISTINEPAIVKGDLELKSKNNLKLEYIPIDTEISIGDKLYTSGLGSMYKESILLGSIISIINKKNDSDRYAIVEPSVNIRSIKEVSVIGGL
ncbi:MAG: rod shape-determining protein MreC [Clostridia bacterium]